MSACDADVDYRIRARLYGELGRRRGVRLSYSGDDDKRGLAAKLAANHAAAVFTALRSLSQIVDDALRLVVHRYYECFHGLYYIILDA